ncbi:MAG: hypothetical protein A4E63_01431 [Syntrophorhabdus sp. PtaU1.Bin050]|nr:MAG: hypothetical protein A4E63_01431 [Syntrophorhabdus sp. PtaU1.Bin050]
MSIAIVDARGWQNTLDLKTGEKIDAAGPVIEMVKDVLQRHPYPGDIAPGSNRWVSDTAFDLIDRYNPRFVFLTYAAQYFSGRYTPMPKETRARMISDVFLEAERFIDRSGFAAIAVGTGDMTPLLGFIDITRLDGLAVCTHWSTRYAGLYGPSPEDMKLLGQHPHIEKIIPQEEVLSLFGGTSEQALRLPEYLMLAHEGYAFKTISDAMRMPVMIPSLNFNIPLHAPGHTVGAITGIRQALEKDLLEKNVALIAIEGVGLDEFLWPHLPCRNGMEWYYYEPGEAQYLTIVSGRHRFLDYPTGSGYKYFNGAEGATRSYPFSGHFKSIPEGTFANTFPGRSIAVGNKSMFMHMVTGADISVECFARNLYNQGTMAVIHRQDKL